MCARTAAPSVKVNNVGQEAPDHLFVQRETALLGNTMSNPRHDGLPISPNPPMLKTWETRLLPDTAAPSSQC
jgi:hypothetical protein